MSTRKAFLTAEWRYLAMLNYEVERGILEPKLPAGTELDFFNGRTFVSVIGFRFLATRLMGVRIPFHSDFDEVNLRFYVRRQEGGAVKRGVVFIREIVPHATIARVARWAYNENYMALPMRHQIEATGETGPARVEYAWRVANCWNRLSVLCDGGASAPLPEGSLQQFIAEHYWGYTGQADGGTVEYEVAHPPWRIWPVARAELELDGAPLFDDAFSGVLHRSPDSAFLADGSAVTVFRHRRLAIGD
jgi:uncharacterized protein YqjF (DUF2071 family)